MRDYIEEAEQKFGGVRWSRWSGEQQVEFVKSLTSADEAALRVPGILAMVVRNYDHLCDSLKTVIERWRSNAPLDRAIRAHDAQGNA